MLRGLAIKLLVLGHLVKLLRDLEELIVHLENRPKAQANNKMASPREKER